MRLVKKLHKSIILALLMWSAIFISGCGAKKVVEKDDSVKVTMMSRNLTITQYKDGKTTYKFITPKMVRYEGVGESGKDTVYMIFEEGIEVMTFNDSTDSIETRITARYAVHRETIGEWEARDSVVGLSKDGKILYTDLLFWNQRDKKIHSPIATKVVDGEETITGINGFESDEEMSDILFINSRGRFKIDTLSNKN